MPILLRMTAHRRLTALATLATLAAPLLTAAPAAAQASNRPDAPVAFRAATFNIEDLRTHELKPPFSDRVLRAVEILQRVRPNVVLINEIAYDVFGGPDVSPTDEPAQNARRLAELLATPQAPNLEPLRMTAWTDQVNTGRASGFDLDRSGQAITTIPAQPEPNPDGSPVRQTADGRAFGNDAWGFGTFPGQYGMALLVDERLDVVEDRIRTFRLFPWDFMPRNLMPTTTNERGDTVPWYEGDAGELFRLSSKSIWDIPVRMPNGAVIRFLASHPAPPAFDGAEQRNKRRNYDEIRFLADYIDNAAYIVDDTGVAGGLPSSAHFVILGDLNADPDEGSSINDPIGSLLLTSRHIAPDPRPTSTITIEGLDPDDTADFGLRVDYVLASDSLTVLDSGVWRLAPGGQPFPSDHFPVWADIAVPAPR